MANSNASATTLTQKVIAIAVMIVVISTVALPVIGDMQDGETKTGSNTPIYRLDLLNDSAAHTLSFADSTATYGDYVISFTGVTSGTLLAFSDTFMAFYRSSSGDMRIYVNDGSAPYGAMSSITFENGIATWTASGNTYTKAYSWLYVPNQNGSLGAFNTGDTIKFNASSELWAFQYNLDVKNQDLEPATIRYVTALNHGTYNNMQSVIAYTANESVTSTDSVVSLNAISDDGYLTYIVGSSTADYTVENNLGVYTASLKFFVTAPVEYTYTTGNDWANLIGVLPILLILVPVMMAVRMIATRRN